MQSTRRGIQLGFLALVLVGVFVMGGNCEAWCPFGGVELLTTYIPEGALTCSLASSNLYALIALLGLTLLAGRVFCGWLCPLGTIGEVMGRCGDRVLGRRWSPPRWLDRALSLLKYAVFALVLVFTYRVGELVFRAYDPCYALISRHGHEITMWAYVALGGLVVGSFFTRLPFCRWLCPLAATLNPVGRLRPLRIQRDSDACTGCGLCDRRCEMGIPVSSCRAVTHARCTGCLECLSACPEKAGALRLGAAGLRARLPWLVLPALVLAAAGAAVALSEHYPFPTLRRERGEPPAEARLRTESFSVEGLRCRTGAENFCELLMGRMDEHAIEGYLRVDCYAAPGVGRAHVTFEEGRADRGRIIAAFEMPEMDLGALRLDDLFARPAAPAPVAPAQPEADVGHGDEDEPTTFRCVDP